MTDELEVGFIGLGVMGGPQSANLITKSGRTVRVFDLDVEAVERAVQLGARRADSVTELAASCDVIFLSLPSGAHVERVVRQEGGILERGREGTVVVDLSTSPATLAGELAPDLAERGLDFIDAPVSRTREAAIAGTLSITAGGPVTSFRRVEPLLRCMASDVMHCGGHGAGALVKLANNLVVFETVVAISEALALIRRSGLAEEAVAFEALAQGSAGSFALEHHGRDALLPDEHEEGRFSAAYMLKDVGYSLDLADRLGLDLPSAKVAYELLERTIDAGAANRYHTAVSHVIDPALGAWDRDA